ncbi:MAG TPA: ferric reductase-like transmembrane domain-containing protein [Acidimicrobiales bacterium]|nr:ferric reductase-like transmembrane domain-containing protein [Acidimicrobiales bacterium]
MTAGLTAALTAGQSKADWYLMRGTGLVALVLFTVTLVLGVAGVRGWSRPGWPRAVVAVVHRNAALLAVLFLTVHIVTAIVDPYVTVGWLAAVVPLVSHWDPVWTGLGALSLDLALAVVATSLLRARLGRRTWRAVHWLAYACWPLAVAHGFLSGTDSPSAWDRVVYGLCLLAVAAAVVWRLRQTGDWAPGAGRVGPAARHRPSPWAEPAVPVAPASPDQRAS